MNKKVFCCLFASLLVVVLATSAAAQEPVVAPAMTAQCDCISPACGCPSPVCLRTCVPCRARVVCAPPCFDACGTPVVWRRGFFGYVRPVYAAPVYRWGAYRGYYF
ncbi:MAG: hypothetical protein ACRCUY_13200 [Thermoguttaceae bacterium]